MCTRSLASQYRSIVTRGLAAVALMFFAFASQSAFGQADPVAAPAPAPIPVAATPSMVELKAAAYDAQQASARAEAEASQAQEALAQAEAAQASVAGGAAATGAAAGVAAAAATPAVAPAPAPIPAVTERDAELEAARKEAREATEEARNAAAAARAAVAQVEALRAARAKRFSRNGFTLSGGAFWAPDLIDTRLTVDSSIGFNTAVGYRFAEHFEADVRYDWINGFDLRGVDTIGKLDGWGITLNARIFFLTGGFQPYFGLGLGAANMTTRLQESSGLLLIDRNDTAVLFRPSLGFDFYVSERLALTADAAIMVPGGALSGLNFATLGAGLKLRF